MEVLFVIPIDEIIKVGLPFIRTQMDEERDKSKLDDFWSYFENNWIDRHKPTYWNRNEILNLTREEREEVFINETNNLLERFNRKMNDKFPTAHPSVAAFVETIKVTSEDYLNELAHLSNARRKVVNKICSLHH